MGREVMVWPLTSLPSWSSWKKMRKVVILENSWMTGFLMCHDKTKSFHTMKDMDHIQCVES
jgi:hypothetical protein